jgi:hypothetical protein
VGLQPTGHTSCNVAFDWSNAAGGCVSSTNGATTSVPANTRILLTASASPPSSITVQAQPGIFEIGSPPATAILYVATDAIADNLGGSYDSAVQIPYGATWPTVGQTVGLGVTQPQ